MLDFYYFNTKNKLLTNKELPWNNSYSMRVIAGLLIFITISFVLLSCSNDEVKGLKAEIRLLKEENNLLKAENIGLKKEIEALYKELNERSLQNEKAAIVEGQKPKEDQDGLSKKAPGSKTPKVKEKEDGKSKGIR